MLRLRPKLGTERNSEWSCCFCFHVRTGTVILGIWHLMLHLVALGFLAAIVRDPKLLEELERDSTPIGSTETRSTPYPQHGTHVRDHSLIYHDVDVGALVTVCTLAITLMLIYGASRGKPAHLLPFFCLQIFDFAITVLTATGYLCYLRSIHRLVTDAKRVPWRDQLLSLPAPALALVVLGAFLVAVLLKAYFISVVWRCYKYLTMRAHAMHSLTPFVISSEGVVTPAASPYAGPPAAPDYSSLLPDYEEAVKQTPPPSYRAATLMTTDPASAPPHAVRDLERGGGEPPPPASPYAGPPDYSGLLPDYEEAVKQAPPPSYRAATLMTTDPASAPVGSAAPVEASQPPPPPPAANTVVMLPQQGEQARV